MRKTNPARTTWAAGILLMIMLLVNGTLPFASETDSPAAISLFNGKDLTGWKAMHEPSEWLAASQVVMSPKNNKIFDIQPGEGILVNGPKGNTSNIYTEYEHGDCQLHIEFMVPKDSNSGVYFQGLYEIQILDSFGKEKLEFGDCGGIYARYKDEKTYEGHPPRVNASKAPGEWQSFDVTFRAPRFDANGQKTENAKFILVKHNGQIVHENVEVTGGTRACMERDEAPRGPLMLQGDHGPVAYRNIQLTPLVLK
ncbi:MAG TPA: DUF1080 domain-containing protein [bacterium]|nr:DUF1080 domain-containing protein [Candidatus Omnitrophota bacterium]HOJ60397.1 DUF1080 domain-containing protein [bacterium]HXK93078.1 DUF1080 domain-containing protein [bacterium]